MTEVFMNDEYLNWVFNQAHNNPLPKRGSMLDMYPSTTSAVDKNGTHHGACIRAQYYERNGQPADPGSETDLAGQLIMDSGTALGDLMSKYFINCNIAVAPNGTEGEQRVLIHRVSPVGKVSYRITGRIDVVCQGPHKDLIGYEFKTVWSSNKANRVIKGWRVTPEPDVKNVMQTALYAHYGRQTLGILDWRLAYLYVEGKVGRVYHITVDSDNMIYVDGNAQPYTVDDIYSQYDRLADALAAQQPPDREGKLFYSDEDLVALAITNQLTKKAQERYNKGDKVLVPWSPCTYCAYIGSCYSPQDAAEAKKAREE